MQNSRAANDPTLKVALAFVLLMLSTVLLHAEDVAGSKDPEGMKRFEGSTLVAYRAPQFDEFLLPLGKRVNFQPVSYTKSLKVEGLVSRYTYGAPMGVSPTELLRNYKEEFKRMGVVTLYEDGPGHLRLGGVMDNMGEEDGLRNLFSGSSISEKDRLLVGKSSDAQPVYYFIYVADKAPSTITERLKDNQTFAQLIVITPKSLQNKMVMSAADMAKSLKDIGRVLLYGVYFDTDQATLKPDSTPTLQSIAELLKNQPQLKLRVVGHTDDQGTAAHNLDLSKRRSESVMKELTTKYSVAADRLDAFGCGLYAPVAPNTAEEGRAKNRRVELLAWGSGS